MSSLSTHVLDTERGEEGGVLIRALLQRRALRASSLADPGVRVQRLDLSLLRQSGQNGARLPERVLEAGELGREPRVALEELVELGEAQLPR